MTLRRKKQWRRLLAIIVAWLFVGFLMTLYDHLVVHSYYVNGPSPGYTFSVALIRNLGGALIGGLLGGSVLVFYIQEKFQDKPYVYSILIVGGSFLVIVGLVSIVMRRWVIPMLSPADVNVAASSFVWFDPLSVKAVVAWSVIVAATQLFLQVNNKFGQGVFLHLLFGKYNTPKPEKRIFMFLDLNSSTALAEQLGDQQYHAFLKDFYADITQPIIEHRGDIYQYVGDEVVVSWDYRDGLDEAHCVRCFYDIRQEISARREKYVSRYGVVPRFKAGIHCGEVIAGEVGIVKRDITYSGDVLNTTSRIQHLCKTLQVDLLLSQELITALPKDTRFTVKPLGSMPLRGKQREVRLGTLQPVVSDSASDVVVR